MNPTFKIFSLVLPSMILASTLSTILLAQSDANPAVARTRIPSSNRISNRINESEVVTLSGNTHPLARPEFDEGVVSAETRLERMVLLLQPTPEQQSRLDRLSEAQQNPDSPLYHGWLSAEEYGARFGASSGDVARLSAWLISHGFEVEPAAAGRRSIVFSGTAAQIEDTFHTQMHHYRVAGHAHIANAEDPQIPSSLVPVVAGILSLNDFRRHSQAHLVRTIADPNQARAGAATLAAAGSSTINPDNTESGSHYLFPADLASIYDVNPIYAAGKKGDGISIAIVGRSNINLNDVSSFRSYAGLSANAPQVILDGRNPGLVAGDQDEATLDVEWAGGVAPHAKIKLVAAASTSTTDGIDLAAQYIVNNKVAPVMSTSFGSCEAHMGAAEVAFYNGLWQQAAAEGISAFVSSGDSGASGCDSGSATTGSGAAVNGLCTSPYVTCVGGTEFNDASGNYWAPANGAGGGSALSYIREKVWNESGLDGGQGLWASGGGISQIFAQPSWQKSVPGANSNGMRAVPDVALNAASHDGYLVELNNSWYDFSGTSAASPSFAAIMALLVEKQAGVGQGNINPRLYGLLSASADPFHATPSGNNSVAGVGGFTAAGAAYNLATGLGSVDANVLVNAWPVASKVVPVSYTLQPSIAAISVVTGKSITFAVAVSAAQGVSGTVSLTASKLPAGVSVSFNPAVIKVGATSTVTLTAANSSLAGASSILLTATGPTAQATAAVSLTVQAPPSLAIAAFASKVQLVQGKTATLFVTATTAGAYSGPVTLALSGVPANVTAVWSASTWNATGAGSFSSAVTLTAGATAALNTSILKIAASGDGLQTQTTTSLQVVVPASISLAVSSSTLSMKSTGATQTVLTVTPIGGVKPAANLAGVTFQIYSLPGGVTAAWSKITTSATGALQSTLTLSGSKTAPTGGAKIVIKATVQDTVSKSFYTVTEQGTLQLTAK